MHAKPSRHIGNDWTVVILVKSWNHHPKEKSNQASYHWRLSSTSKSTHATKRKDHQSNIKENRNRVGEGFSHPTRIKKDSTPTQCRHNDCKYGDKERKKNGDEGANFHFSIFCQSFKTASFKALRFIYFNWVTALQRTFFKSFRLIVK